MSLPLRTPLFLILLATPLWAAVLPSVLGLIPGGPVISQQGQVSVSGGVSVSATASLPTLPTLPTVSISTPSLPEIPVPNVDGVCECPVIPNLSALVCILDWISHVKILSKEVRTVDGVTFSQYTLQHLEIFKGNLSLPTVLIVPEGPCGLELEVQVDYLLSGLVTGQTNLYSVLCLQVLNVLSPVWTLVDESLINQLGFLSVLGQIVCLILNGLLSPLLGLITIPPFFNNLPIPSLL